MPPTGGGEVRHARLLFVFAISAEIRPTTSPSSSSSALRHPRRAFVRHAPGMRSTSRWPERSVGLFSFAHPLCRFLLSGIAIRLCHRLLRRLGRPQFTADTLDIGPDRPLACPHGVPGGPLGCVGHHAASAAGGLSAGFTAGLTPSCSRAALPLVSTTFQTAFSLARCRAPSPVASAPFAATGTAAALRRSASCRSVFFGW